MSYLPVPKLYPCFCSGRWQQCLISCGLRAIVGAFWRSVIHNLPLELLPICTWPTPNCQQLAVGSCEAGG